MVVESRTLSYSITRDSIPILWLDDDGDMRWDDLEGDTKNDCLLIDRNRDGIYGGHGDLIIDWIDTDNDGKADMQIVASILPESGRSMAKRTLYDRAGY